jgi:3-oxo-5-alpha-steroid 4-dehydrogenase 1
MEGWFTGPQSYHFLLWIWSSVALAVFIGLFFLTAPYGRHARRGWGPTVDSTWGWVWMELAAVVTVPALFYVSGRRDPLSWLWLLLWELHYVNRTFIFPFRRVRSAHRTPWVIVAMGATFNLVNGYIIGHGLFVLAPARQLSWFERPAVLLGLCLFLGGLALNLDSDNRLLRLRRATGRYAVPHGGGFRWVSSPNYLGEIVEWSGWALATASLAGLVFAWWTVANLVPRAWANHRWYGTNFPEYPAGKRALIPWVW